MSTREDQLLDLLERWCDAQQRSQPISVEALCGDHTELLEPLRRQIDVLLFLEGLTDPNPGAEETGSRAVAASTPDSRLAPATLSAGQLDPPAAQTGQDALQAVPGHVELENIGGGGMGTVYRARNVRLGRLVALKLIHADQLSPAMRQRLEAEARAVAALDHPHIVKVFEVGECQPAGGGPPVPFIALEYVSGGSLEKRLAGQALPPAEAARLVLLLARAMQHAHARGVVHRDLKPANVLLAPPADEQALNTSLGCPKVTDFGLARQVTAEQRLTHTGAVLGTPSYMAPEQAEGSSAVGPAADVWALGVILYRLLAGRKPFESPSLTDLLHKVCHETPAPLRQVRPGVPEELERLCLNCLEKAPERRPAAADLAARLERFLARPPRETTPTASNLTVSGSIPAPAAPTPAAPLLSRRRVLGLALAGAAAGLGGLAVWLWPEKKAPEHPGGSEPEALAGELIVRVWAPRLAKKGLRIGLDEGAVPVREDEQLQMEVRLSEPAYAFLLWIDGKGVVTPLFPWNDGKIEVESVAVSPPVRRARSVRSPSVQSKGWLVDDTVGLDLILLLARREPLPAGFDLAKLLGKAPRAPLRDPREVAVRGWDRGQPVESVKHDLVRGPKNEAREIDDQLEQVAGRLAGEFELIRAVQFAHAGKGD
jgi:hypothetical protein